MAGIKLLIIEDEQETANMLKTFLEMFDIEVTVALTGMQGMMGVSQEKPDVLIMDLMLPDADGYQLLRLLRHSPATREMPVVVLTARTTREDEQRGYRAGATSYLKKPVDLNRLVEEVKRVAETRHTGPFPDMPEEQASRPEPDRPPSPRPTQPLSGRHETLHIPGMYIPRENDGKTKKD